MKTVAPDLFQKQTEVSQGKVTGASAAAVEAHQLLLDRIAAAEAATAAGSGNRGLTDRYAARPDSSDLAGRIQGSQPPQSESGYFTV